MADGGRHAVHGEPRQPQLTGPPRALLRVPAHGGRPVRPRHSPPVALAVACRGVLQAVQEGVFPVKRFNESKRKVIKRVVKIRSSDRAIADAEWGLALSEAGVRIWRLGHLSEGTMHLSWRSVIGHALIHRAGVRLV